MKWEEFKEEMKNEDLSSAFFFAMMGFAYVLLWVYFVSKDNSDLDTTGLLIMGTFALLVSYHIYNRYRLKKIIVLMENMQHHLETLGNQTAEPVKGSGRCEDSAEWEDLYQKNPPN